MSQVQPPSRSSKTARSLLAVAAASLAACAEPSWHVGAEPEGARLFIDGRHRYPSPQTGKIPYYGTAEITAVPAVAARDADGHRREIARGKLVIDEPVTPWLFPLDFVFEMARLPFVDDPVPTLMMTAPPRQDESVRGEAPRGLEDFLARARRAAVER
ncbi:MAG: hypothetical protein AB7I19_19880 [Planctomycetota bacterium]